MTVKVDLTGIADATPKGVGKVFNLIFKKSIRNKLLMDAQTEKDILKIRSGDAEYDIKNKALKNIIPNDDETFKDLIIKSFQDEEIQNLIACAKVANSNINNDEEIDDEIDPYFVNRWSYDAKLINDETLQNLWGRILAQEINEPDSISLRTLDVIKNISRKEADYFMKIIDFICFDNLVMNLSAPIEELNNLSFIENAVRHLRNAGLVISYTQNMYSSALWPSAQLASGEYVYYLENKDLSFYILSEKNSSAPSTVRWELTEAAICLYNMIKNDCPSTEEFKKIVRQYMKDNDVFFINKE